MSAVLALLQRDDDWTGYLWFVVFVVVPLLARFIKWLFARLGLVKDAGEQEESERRERRERLERARAERRQDESEGGELWRRLARGEIAEPPAAPRKPASGPQASSLETEEEPEPLSVLGGITELSEAPETSLEKEEEPVPLEALGKPAALVQAPPAQALPVRARFRLARGEMRRAIVLNEVLGPPVSERALRA